MIFCFYMTGSESGPSDPQPEAEENTINWILDAIAPEEHAVGIESEQPRPEFLKELAARFNDRRIE